MGASVVFDPVGGPGFLKLIEALTIRGTAYLYGALSEQVTPLPGIEFVANLQTVKGPNIWQTSGDPVLQKVGVDYILKGIASGQLKPIVDKIFAFDEIVEAHRYLEAGNQFGKIVVTVQNDDRRSCPTLRKERSMSRIFITGSTDGLGLAAARTLMADGHEVLLHARSEGRAAALPALSSRSVGVVIGDLSSALETRSIADQVNRVGAMDAIIHNAGIYLESSRDGTPEGYARTLAVNTLAPYILTALIHRPVRLVYICSGAHRRGSDFLDDIDWTQRRWNASQAYSESKLYLATLGASVARRWPEVLSNAVDPGWVPTKMGGVGAPDDLALGHQTQTWLSVSKDHAARTTGGYWYHRQRITPAAEVVDAAFQDRLMERLAELTGVRLF
jgi:NAD(P)-dependent dehydrogenase (short-subunit alcohol dehydrogenase family)